MKKIFVAMVVAIIAPTALYAKPWPKEPDSFIGVPIGQPLPDAIPECPKTTHDKLISQSICLDRSGVSYGLARMYGLPREIEFVGYPYYMIKKGVVASAVVKVKHSDYRRLKELFIERYGHPTEKTSVDLQNSMGAKVKSEILVWRGKKVRIEVVEFASTLNESGAFVFDLASEDSRKKESTDGIRKGAGSL